MRIEWFEILYTGILSAGVGYTLQIMAQHKASPAPAAIILSMVYFMADQQLQVISM